MVMRAVEGIRVDEQSLAFDLIKEVGPAGHFVLLAPHPQVHAQRTVPDPDQRPRGPPHNGKRRARKTPGPAAPSGLREILAVTPQPMLDADLRARAGAGNPRSAGGDHGPGG